MIEHCDKLELEELLRCRRWPQYQPGFRQPGFRPPASGVGASRMPQFILPGQDRSAFTPASLPSLAAWYDASDITTLFQDSAFATPITADGQTVGGWKDKSGNGNHLVQATPANRPVYHSGGNLPYVTFDGTASFLATSGNVNIGDTNTMFLVYKLGLLGSAQVFFGNTAAGDAGLVILIDSSNPNHVYTSTNQHSIAAASITEDATTKRNFIATRNGSGTDNLYRNGVDVTGTVVPITITTATLPLYAGRNPGASNLFYKGNLSTFGLTGARLSASQVAQLANWMASK